MNKVFLIKWWLNIKWGRCQNTFRTLI